jgi:hypothetical protein
VSNNRHHRQWTPADVDGRSFPGQTCRNAGSPHHDLASGRRGQQSQFASLIRARPRLVRRYTPARSAVRLPRCVAELSRTGSRRRRYAAPLARRQRRRSALAGPRGARRAATARLARSVRPIRHTDQKQAPGSLSPIRPSSLHAGLPPRTPRRKAPVALLFQHPPAYAARGRGTCTRTGDRTRLH